MELQLYYQLGSRSRKAIKRQRRRDGRPYVYNPRGDLLQRLARENGLTIEQAQTQLLRERKELLKGIQM